jgi:hypothetical protein
MARPSITTSVTRPSSSLEVDAVEITNTSSASTGVTAALVASVVKATSHVAAVALNVALNVAIALGRAVSGGAAVETEFTALKSPAAEIPEWIAAVTH